MYTNYIKINNTSAKIVNFKSQNPKYNLLILHWWGWSSDSWLEVWEMLSKNWFNVYIPDLPWFWETKLNKIYTLDDYAFFVEELIKKLNIKDELIIMWHSNWWAISIKLETRKNILFKKLILNNSAWIRKSGKITLKRKILYLIVKIFKPFSFLPWFWKLRILFYKAIWNHDYINASKNEFLKETYKNMIWEDLQGIIPQIKTDTLLIWWAKDTYTPLWMWNKMKNMIKNSKIITLLWERHWIHLQNPSLLVKTILDNI